MKDKLYNVYQSLNDSPMQEKLRKIRPWPVGVVFIEQPGMTLDDVRAEFRRMKKLGYNATKQICLMPGTDREAVMNIALDEGIIPWWYGEGGWEDPTPEILEELGIDPAISMKELRENPVWLARQDKIMRERIYREVHKTEATGVATVGGKENGLPGELKAFEYGLDPCFSELFCKYLKEKYETVENLCECWNFNHCLIQKYDWKTWEDVEKDCVTAANRERAEYCRIADMYEFKAYLNTQRVATHMQAQANIDKNAPLRAGGEVGLFHPLVCYSCDMEGIASSMRDIGSYYPSMHISWHFQQSLFEVAKPFYIQSQMAEGFFKGGWAATWESTAGPQILTGGKSTYIPTTEMVPGSTVDEGVLCQIMLSWVAAGFRGFGLWCANPRTAGWEGGEYGLFDSDNEITGRAVIAGKIGQACNRYRDELWSAQKQPVVGIVIDKRSDAMWAAVSLGGRDHFKETPSLARIGASRALINGNIPWEFVTMKNLSDGLIDRYDVLYFPASLGFDVKMIPTIRAFCEKGGRVVIDAPTGWYNHNGTVLNSKAGTDFEQLFGVRLANFQYASQNSRPWRSQGHALEGFMTDLVPTTAKVIRTFDHGAPMITKNKVGMGDAVVIGTAAALSCHKPGNTFVEELLCDTLTVNKDIPYACEGANVYMLASETADHYFLINENDARTVALHTNEEYRSVCDALTGAEVSLQSIDLEGYSGRWIRCEK